MKKIIFSIVLFSYLAVSSGVIISFHYCMNRLASTQLFAAESKQCGKCGMQTKDSNGCCRDEVKMVKMEDDQKLTASFTFELPALYAVYHLPSDFITASLYNIPATRHFLNHSPPLLSSQDTYLQNSVFRI
ncbi:MAG: HYC_CC_PP family protein [Chitinophagaceae bacterium]